MATVTTRRTSHPNRKRRAARIAAAATTASLIAAAPAAAVSSMPEVDMKVGTHGKQVAQVQHALHLQASGRFGPKTRDAVRRFQHDHQLIVDGIVGVRTWDALFHIAAPVQAATPTVAGAPASSSYSSGGYTIPSGIVQCESGGNYSAVNSSSGAGGAYQIMPSTWHAYGGQGLPQDASPAEQGRIASEIYANQGPGAWTC